jgi:hypothetical protein
LPLAGNHVTKNKLRTATIWMDEFGWLAKDQLGNPHTEMGPLDKMMALRKKLNCKPFKYIGIRSGSGGGPRRRWAFCRQARIELTVAVVACVM